MKLIGAGLPRTGTLSQKVALDMLGYGPCYHMVNVLADLRLAPLWTEAANGSADWEKIFDGFDSTVDWPGSAFYKELVDVYPDAKVLLSVRDPEKWERSMRETVWGIIHGPTLPRHMSSARELVDPAWAGYLEMIRTIGWNDGTGQLAGDHASTQGLIELFNAHTEDVKRTVSADRLLVWDVTEGWGPLCEFLEVPVPDVPVPHVNDGEEFKNRVVQQALASLNAYWEEHGGEVTGATPAKAPAAT